MLAVCMAAFPAWAAEPDTPQHIVADFYKPYMAYQQHADTREPPDALDIILPHASKSLKQAIKKDEEC